MPRSPTGFSIAKKNEAASNIMVTIDWNTLQNNNPDIMMSESYQVAITPRSLSHPISTVVNYPPLSVTLNYNVIYTVRLTVEGCAGKSHPLTMRVQYSMSILIYFVAVYIACQFGAIIHKIHLI